MVTGILFFTIAVMNAKSVEGAKALISTPGFCSEEELVNRLAMDYDFKKYYISNVEFANKVIETGAGTLLLKYFQNKTSAEESAILFAKMNVPGKKEFDAIAVNLKNEALAFFNKFPELKLRTEKEQKELLFSAFKKISADNSITTKFVKARNVTPEQCFWWWMVCNTACFIGCTYNNNNECYWQCAAFCAVEYGACWVIAS